MRRRNIPLRRLIIYVIMAEFTSVWLMLCHYGWIYVIMAEFMSVWLSLCQYGWCYVIMAEFMSVWLMLCHYGWVYVNYIRVYVTMSEFMALCLSLWHYVWVYVIMFEFMSLCLSLCHYDWAAVHILLWCWIIVLVSMLIDKGRTEGGDHCLIVNRFCNNKTRRNIIFVYKLLQDNYFHLTRL